MSTLKSALNVLCNNDGLTGGLIITKDGMIIESNLENEKDAETFGAFMSQIAVTINNSLSSLGHDDFSRYVIQSSHGRIFLVDLGKTVLIALTELEIDAGKVNVALFQAANEIKKTGRMDV